MNQPSIQEEIELMRKTTAKILRSKKSALKFLRDARILELLEEEPKRKSKTKK